MSEHLQKRIDMLERKLARQIEARREAENQLEKFSTEIYHSNRALQDAVLEVQKRQEELEFLANSTSVFSSEASVSELVSNTLELTGQFCDAKMGSSIYVGDGKILSFPAALLWTKKGSTEPLPNLQSSLTEHIPVSLSELVEQWVVKEVSIKEYPDINWVVAINFNVSGNQTGWMSFYLTSELLDEEVLFVLDTAKTHLREGIEKRIKKESSSISLSVLEQTAEHLAIAKKQLVQAERMSTLGQLAAGVAHEINNPVGFIKSNQDILMENLCQFIKFNDRLKEIAGQQGSIAKLEFEEVFNEYDIEFLTSDSLDIITDNQEGVNRISEIVSGLKTFSHISDNKLEDVNLNECVEKALKIAWNTIKYEHQVELDLTEDLPLLEGNPGELTQILINLIVNAGQAMDKPGKIIITSQYHNRKARVSVTDQGVGMSESVKNRLFTPFFTTKPVGEGTGLGLSVSKAIAEAHRGDILVESEPGMGTTMTLELSR